MGIADLRWRAASSAYLVQELLKGEPASVGFVNVLPRVRAAYGSDHPWSAELIHFDPLLAGDIASRTESSIQSSGYVMHTLEASLWCLLTTETFADCVLKAVNLGGDTDTTGCVAGGLAGVYYGFDAMPEAWLGALARYDEIEALFDAFLKRIQTS